MIAVQDRGGSDLYATRGVLFLMPRANRRDCAEDGHVFRHWHHSRGTTSACANCGLLAEGETDPFRDPHDAIEFEELA